VGVWRASTQTFIKDATSSMTSIDLLKFKTDYPNYYFKISVSHSGATMTVNDADNILFKTYKVAYEDDVQQAIETAENYTDDAIINFASIDLADKSLFEDSTINVDTGANQSSDVQIRTKTYLSDSVRKINRKTNTTYTFYLYAYNKSDDSYVGVWRASTQTFIKDATLSMTSIDLDSFRESFPNYKFRVTVAHGGTSMNVDDAENVILTKISVVNEVDIKNAIKEANYNTKILVESVIHPNVPTGGQIVYIGDTLAETSYIQNAVAYKDGTFIACRSNGKVVKIDYSNQETELLSISGSKMDWRLCWMDSNENVYVSPHASWGTLDMSQRGLYRLEKNGNSFEKVISLYNPESLIPTETESNDDTIWTMCEDDEGNLYAGVYAHTVRSNPAIYKSTDGGETWNYLINFNTANYTASGMHIHSIIYSKWQKALYCIVGEVNTIFKSIDGGSTWEDLHITLDAKGSAMIATEQGVFIGSDGTLLRIDWLHNDDVTVENVFKGWGNTVFAIRQSDISGMLYAFTKIDSSVNNTDIWPPATVLDGTTTIEEWRATITTGQYNSWLNNYNEVYPKYPDDAVRPQHYAILVSRNGGKDWEVLEYISCASTSANGFWCTGQFFNGELLSGRQEDGEILRPMVVSEGRHKYVSGGCDLSGDVFVRLNSSATVSVI
jgi:hypothetical protein